MNLFDIIRNLVKENNLTLQEFGEKLNVSYVYATKLVKGKVGDRDVIPSEEILARIAKMFSKSEEERVRLQKTLLLERMKLIAPPEVKGFFEDKGRVTSFLSGEGMPEAFINRLKKDLEKQSQKKSVTMESLLKKIYDATGITQEEMNAVFEKGYTINRTQVILLARALGQPAEDYLILAEYMPEHIKKIIQSNKQNVLFRSFEQLTPKEIDQFLDAMQKMIDIYLERGKR